MARYPYSHAEHLESRVLMSAAMINWNDVHQSIDGFGASTAWRWDTMPPAALEAALSTSTGAGLSLLRTRMGPSGWSSEGWMMQQVNSYGVRIWSTPWSPPREWKTNHDSYHGGELDPAHYQDYANLLADYVQDMSRQGVQLYAISLQNEPNWNAYYESCIWNAQQFADFIPYVGQTFAARGITTKIMIPESLNWDFSLASVVMANPSLAQYVGILAAHHYDTYGTPYAPVSIANGKTLWETEVTLDGGGSAIGNAVVVADDIHQAMTIANVNAYHYWWLNSNDAQGLMDANWNPTKRLWAMGQYSRFVRPGWVRIGETDDGGPDVTAFKDPASGKFAIVVVNTNDSGSINEAFTLNGVSAGSVTPYVTSASEDMAQYAAIGLSGGTTFSANIAGNSIVTFYGIDATAPAVQAPGNMAAAPAGAPGEDATSQISVTWSDNSSGESAYTIERSLDGSTWTVLKDSLPANTTSYVDTGLAENTRYYYRVKPTNGAANTYSAVASTSTILKAPFYWWSLGATRTDTGFNLSWPIDSAAATGASLDRSTDGLTWSNIASFDTRVTWYVDNIPNYDPNQIYFYRVRVSEGSTYSAYAPWNTGLAAPTDFAASHVRAQSITFTWTNPTEGASGAWIEEYVNGNWNTVSPSSLQATDGKWTIGGLSAQTSYRFRLKTTAEADTVSSPYTTELDVTTIAPIVGPVVWYRADEGSGTALADASGNGSDATLVGSATFGPGVYGDALTLSGGYASLPTGVVAGLSDFTISTWVKPSALDSWSRIFDFGTGMSNYMFLTPNAGGSGLPGFWINTPTGGTQVNSSVALTADKWKHIAVTLSGNTVTLYINGIVAGSGWTGTYPINLGMTTQNYLGKSQYPWDPAFQGSLDDFRIYDHALSGGEILALTQVPPPAAVAFQVSDGSAQRSMISSLTLTFDKPVTLANDAVTLMLRGGTFTGGITLTPSADMTSYAVTFTGIGASLGDGAYILSLKALSVTDSLGQTLGGGDRRFKFYRLFGDANGDRMVNRADLVLFRAALNNPAAYVSYFDYDNNHTIDLLDYAQFRRHLLRRLL